MTAVPVPEYPQVLMDVVAELRVHNYEAAQKLCCDLDPDLAVTTLASMYAELVGRYERARGLDPGRLEAQIRAEYVSVAALCAGGTITAPALFGGPKRSRKVVR